jgi:hypothetical protein
LLTEELALLEQILDCLLLLLIHSARDQDQHGPEPIENAHPSTYYALAQQRPAIRIVLSALKFLEGMT